MGPYLPACSPKTAQFCKGISNKKARQNRHKSATSRSEKRKKNRRRIEKERKRKARRKRKKRKRMLRRRQQGRLRQNNNNKFKNNKRKQQNQVFTMGDIALTMSRRRENRKFQWSSIHGSQNGKKIPPFEALLSSSSNSNSETYSENDEDDTNEEFEDLDPSSYFDKISTSDFETKSADRVGAGRRKIGRKRTPLPLKEAKDELHQPFDEKNNGDQRGWKRRKRK